MTKGYNGESCSEAIREALQPGEVVTFRELLQRVRLRGEWKDEMLWQHLMAVVVNLPPARLHWPRRAPFLFLHGDGRYELYDRDRHPAVKK
ncbi:MAG: hypothetical protein ACYC4L_19505 [Chloroflexota bacterium]